MKENTKKGLLEFLRAILASLVSLVTALTVGSCQIYQNPASDSTVDNVVVDATVKYPN